MMGDSIIRCYGQPGAVGEAAYMSFGLDVYQTMFLGFQFNCHLLAPVPKTEYLTLAS